MRQSDISLLRVEIESGFSDLERVVSEIKEAVKEIGSSIPTYRDKAALGAFLHSFYNGIENVKCIETPCPGGRPQYTRGRGMAA